MLLHLNHCYNYNSLINQSNKAHPYINTNSINMKLTTQSSSLITTLIATFISTATSTVTLKPSNGLATLIPGHSLHFECGILESNKRDAQFKWLV